MQAVSVGGHVWQTITLTEILGGIMRALNDPLVDCCGRDAADCDCPRDGMYRTMGVPYCTDLTGHLPGTDHRWQECPTYH